MNKIKVTAIINGQVKTQETDNWFDLRQWLNEFRDLGLGVVSDVQIEQA